MATRSLARARSILTTTSRSSENHRSLCKVEPLRRRRHERRPNQTTELTEEALPSVGWSRTRSKLLSQSTPFNSASLSLLSLAPSDAPPSPWLALGAFIGLPLALWAYKCVMLVLFQRKIIYMGYVPPDARYQDVSPSKGILCEEVQIQGEGRVKLHGLLVRRDFGALSTQEPKAVIVYLQGNAGNPLGRLPLFERLLLGTSMPGNFTSSILDSVAILAVAPRSYWKSSMRTPTERGLISDYLAALSHAVERFPSTPIILYGHSLGGAVAVCLSAQVKADDVPHVRGLVLENPFASIPWMVKALYPQKWLPYHYLGDFAFDRWDALSAMRDVKPGTLLGRLRKDMLVMLSEKDEIVPKEMGQALYDASKLQDEVGGKASQRLVVIPGVLHDNAWSSRRWRDEIGRYLDSRTS